MANRTVRLAGLNRSAVAVALEDAAMVRDAEPSVPTRPVASVPAVTVSGVVAFDLPTCPVPARCAVMEVVLTVPRRRYRWQ